MYVLAFNPTSQKRLLAPCSRSEEATLAAQWEKLARIALSFSLYNTQWGKATEHCTQRETSSLYKARHRVGRRQQIKSLVERK